MTDEPVNTNLLRRYGFDEFFANALRERGADASAPARVMAQHKGGYFLISEEGELLGELSGSLKRAAKRGEQEKPAVGDWVLIDPRKNEESATIHAVLPRRTKLSRKAAGRAAEQVLAANVDIAFLVSALDDDLNLRRIERYLSVVLSGGVKPVIVLTKADLCDHVDECIAFCESVAAGAPIHALSSLSGKGLEALEPYFATSPTVVVLGSSGVGKSTLINRWFGEERLATGHVRQDGKGKHTTTHREIFVRPQGGLVIDTPGMRELGLWDAEEGMSEAFAEIEELLGTCRFSDCQHQREPGCALRNAVAEGRIDPERLESFLKLRGELAEMDEKRALAERMRKKREAQIMGRVRSAWSRQKRG